MSWWMALILIAGSIVFYTHILPILDRVSEYIQGFILTKKMKMSIDYAQYEKMVNDIRESKSQKVIGFQVQDNNYEEADNNDE